MYHMHKHYAVVAVDPTSWMISSVTTKPAMLALVSVLMAPAMRADSATRETSPDRLGASWDRTPICAPRDPRLANPQRAYVAMRRERGVRSA